MRTVALRFLCLALLTVAVAACATTPATKTRTDRNRITAEEVQQSQATDAYEVVQRLRPQWLNVRGGGSLTRGTGILVYLNSSRLGGVESLRQIEIETIQELEFYDQSKAVAMLSGIGSDAIAGAIIVHTRVGSGS